MRQIINNMWGLTSSKNLTIDLGNNNILITDQSSILLSHPSFLVVNEENNKVEAVSDRANEMLEKTHSHLKPIKPLKRGAISDGESAKKNVKGTGAQSRSSFTARVRL
jgi:rod shape-determining protein MreB and related proteins